MDTFWAYAKTWVQRLRTCTVSTSFQSGSRRLELGIPISNLTIGNGEELPYGNGTFDLVLLFSVLTSILDPRVQANLAAEARRVLRPGGAILWYDTPVRQSVESPCQRAEPAGRRAPLSGPVA